MLRDRADQILALRALQKVQVGVDVVLLGRVVRCEDAGHLHAYRSPIENLSPTFMSAAAGDRPTDDRGILMLLEVRPIARQQFKVAGRAQLLRRQSVEDDHVEAGAAIVREDLNRNDLADAVESLDLELVILRQMAGGRTKLVGLEHDERLLRCLRRCRSFMPCCTEPTKQNTNSATAEPLTVRMVRERCRHSVFSM